MYSLRNFVLRNMWLRVVIDGCLIAVSFFVALAIRFEFAVPSEYLSRFLLALPGIVLLFLSTNYLSKIYARRWKYACFDELVHLTIAALISTAILLLGVVLIPNARSAVPASVAMIGGVLSLFTLAFVRMQFRLFFERDLRLRKKGRRKVLLIGAGEVGETVVRDMLRHPEYDYQPAGFIDDDPAKRKMVVQGVPVLGSREQIPKIVEELQVDEIFITIPSVSGEAVREIIPYCEQTGVEIKILPGIILAMTGEASVAAVRELRLEDLLGREPVSIDLESISAYIRDKAVMITGAAGSIGSELASQLSGISPRLLILLDKDETGLYELETDMALRGDECPAEVVIADIRDSDRLEAVFNHYRPQVVFHSAAMKHVPLMELHPSEAVKNNILGTQNVASQAMKHGVERFILISTDKGVHPVSILGATKLVSELLIKSYNKQNGTLFSAVRFGNVLGSRGSVVTVFKKQIEKGGPVLVTHPDIQRYFMTVEEAAQLVIQAGAFTEGGDLFILEMGEPIPIIDIANQMVLLLGGDKEIEIRMTGLRPGERLNERLVFKSEELIPTRHPKINRVVHDYELPTDFDAQVAAIVEAAVRDDKDDIRVLLSRLLPSYDPR